MPTNWKEIANWYYVHSFFDAAQAANDPDSELRRYGNIGLIQAAIGVEDRYRENIARAKAFNADTRNIVSAALSRI
jgi:hypothetical protein